MAKIAVAPLVGAWIEIVWTKFITSTEVSLPSWERGLKSMMKVKGQMICVAPLVGAWIEIPKSDVMLRTLPSLPSWERGLKLPPSFCYPKKHSSLPSWERGLKSLATDYMYKTGDSRSPRGSVD